MEFLFSIGIGFWIGAMATCNVAYITPQEMDTATIRCAQAQGVEYLKISGAFKCKNGLSGSIK
jgi:hypothetical protein